MQTKTIASRFMLHAATSTAWDQWAGIVDAFNADHEWAGFDPQFGKHVSKMHLEIEERDFFANPVQVLNSACTAST